MIALSCYRRLCTDCCFDPNATVVHMTKLIWNQNMACCWVFLFVPQDQFWSICTCHSFDSSPFLLSLNSSIHSVLMSSLHATTSPAFTKFIHLPIICAVYKKINIFLTTTLSSLTKMVTVGEGSWHRDLAEHCCLLSSYKILSWSTSPDQEASRDLPPTLVLFLSPCLAETPFR